MEAASEPFEFFAGDGTRLSGTLVRPDTTEPLRAALLISGSGPIDRNSNMPGQDLNIANAIAAALASDGIASLRYDKRGTGESGGEYLRTGFEEETDDAAIALEALRHTPGVDGGRLTVIGHSVGATIAIRLASQYDWIAGIVLLAGAAQRGVGVMEWQSRRIAESLGRPRWLRRRRFLRRQQQGRELLLASDGDVIQIEGSEIPARWYREYMSFDPMPDLGKISCPVLAITGRHDIQVDPSDIEKIGGAVQGPFSGHSPDQLTHILRVHPGRPSLESYRGQLSQPVEPALLTIITEWAASH